MSRRFAKASVSHAQGSQTFLSQFEKEFTRCSIEQAPPPLPPYAGEIEKSASAWGYPGEVWDGRWLKIPHRQSCANVHGARRQRQPLLPGAPQSDQGSPRTACPPLASLSWKRPPRAFQRESELVADSTKSVRADQARRSFRGRRVRVRWRSVILARSSARRRRAQISPPSAPQRNKSR